VFCAILRAMVGWPGVLLSGELGDLTEDVRRLFQELGHTSVGRATAAGDCLPPLDVLETDDSLQILMDLPGVPAASVRVLIKGSVVLIAGEKWADSPGPGAGGYHLVERGSGRFARAVRVTGAFDGSRVHATLAGGELRITLPKLADRRGRGIDVPVTTGSITSTAPSA
jgi:HSP20 family protein